MPILHSPKAYRERSTPVSHEQANKNCEEFLMAVHELMTKHHIADCGIVLEVAIDIPARDLTEQDDETFVNAVAHFGDQHKMVPMAAYAAAFTRAEFDGLVSRKKAAGAKTGSRV